MLLCLFVDNLM